MRAWRTTLFMLVAVAPSLLVSCDTAENMESPLDKYYVKYVGGDGRQWGVDMVVAADGSIFMLGNTTSSDNGQQLYVARTTIGGIVEWERRFGDINDDYAKDIEMLSNGTLAILGTVKDAISGRTDFIIRLMDVNNNVIDSVTYGSPSFDEEAVSISETTDSFIVTGYTDNVPSPLTNPSDAFFVRFYKDLNIYSNSWSTSFGLGDTFDAAVKTIEVITPSSTLYYVFGNTNKLLTNDGIPDHNAFVWVLGTSGGDPVNEFIISNDLFPNSNPAMVTDEIVSAVSVVPGGGFLMTGYSVTASRNEQAIFAIKIRRDIALIPNDSVKNILQNIPRTDSSSLSNISVSKTSVFPSRGSGFFVLGTESHSGNENIYLKKLGNNLSDAWSAPPSFLFGGIGRDQPGAVLESPDGRILVLGTMVLGEANGQEKIVLIKLSPNGKLGE